MGMCFGWAVLVALQHRGLVPVRREVKKCSRTKSQYRWNHLSPSLRLTPEHRLYRNSLGAQHLTPLLLLSTVAADAIAHVTLEESPYLHKSRCEQDRIENP